MILNHNFDQNQSNARLEEIKRKTLQNQTQDLKKSNAGLKEVLRKTKSRQ